MSESEFSIDFEAGLPEVLPGHAKLSVGYAKRWTKRGADVLDAISEAVGGADKLEARAAVSEEVDAILARAAVAGADSALLQKRKLLAGSLRRPSWMTQKVDEAALIVDTLGQIDAVHVRALEAIHRAETEARESGEMGPVARAAEKPPTTPVREVVERLPEGVLRRLESVGLISGSLTWDGTGHISGLTSFGEQVLEDLRSATHDEPLGPLEASGAQPTEPAERCAFTHPHPWQYLGFCRRRAASSTFIKRDGGPDGRQNRRVPVRDR
jgi:hypothetical protein